MDVIDMALDAAMAVLDRYGALWGNDVPHVRDQLAVIMSAVAELSNGGGSGDDAAKELLLSLRRKDAPIPPRLI